MGIYIGTVKLLLINNLIKPATMDKCEITLIV